MNLDNLGKIQRVEAPPYLFTRIQQKIEHIKKGKISTGAILAMSFSFAVLLLINIVVLTNYNTNSSAAENYAASIHLTTNNSLYK